jgi:pimeloyl-ACP methyl ester carboxylesterase
MKGLPANFPARVLPLYPFEPGRFTTPARAQLSYLDEGPRSAEAIVMVHGNPTWSFYYRNLVRELRPSMRCIAPDHIGMGLSEKPQDYPYHLAQRIADFGALIGRLGLQKVHLLVHDWGGAIGLGWAVDNPDRVGRIGILNTAAFASRRIPRRIALCRLPILGALIVRGANGFARPATWMAMSARSLTDEEKLGYLYPYRSWRDRIGVHRFVRDIPMERGHPSRPALEAVEAGLPRLRSKSIRILWGGRDFCFNRHFLARWRTLFPQAEVDEDEHAGHFVLEDASTEARARLRRFFTDSRP